MNKDIIYNNIYDLLQNGIYFEKYCELTKDISLDGLDGIRYDKTLEELESTSANIFNAILIGCQLFDDIERRERFVEDFKNGISRLKLQMYLPDYNMSEEEARERLKNGFGIHFTTPKIIEQICKTGVLSAFGNNLMIIEEEDKVIEKAIKTQKERCDSKEYYSFLSKGFGTGVSSYSSIANGFWMYRTPESLTFLFGGNVASRDKEKAMEHVVKRISLLDKKDKIETLDTMSNIWDRLVGDEQEIGCVLIDRDGFDYPIDYYYKSGEPIAVQRRPYSKSLKSINNNDCKIPNDIDIQYLRFITLPTIYKLEEEKKKMGDQNDNVSRGSNKVL